MPAPPIAATVLVNAMLTALQIKQSCSSDASTKGLRLDYAAQTTSDNGR